MSHFSPICPPFLHHFPPFFFLVGTVSYIFHDVFVTTSHFPPFFSIFPHFPPFFLIFPHFSHFPHFSSGLLDTGILRIWILPRPATGILSLNAPPPPPPHSRSGQGSVDLVPCRCRRTASALQQASPLSLKAPAPLPKCPMRAQSGGCLPPTSPSSVKPTGARSPAGPCVQVAPIPNKARLWQLDFAQVKQQREDLQRECMEHAEDPEHFEVVWDELCQQTVVCVPW